MANTQSDSSRGVESRSHDGVTLRSGRRIQYESPVARRQATPSLERSQEGRRRQVSNAVKKTGDAKSRTQSG